MTEQYFKSFRENIVGINQKFPSPEGEQKIIYADWIASGRLYGPIEKTMTDTIAPFCANTHTETSMTGTLMTKAYHEAKNFIKQEVNACEDDILIFSGSGMTDSINKLQRMLGLRIPENANHYLASFEKSSSENRPIIFVTHLEHHSNHTSWLETIADVEIIHPDSDGNVDLDSLKQLLEEYKNRPLKIASVSACSNVTGIFTPYFDIANLMHENGGYCFVDFACSGPYVDINMHPENKNQQLDAIFISPHKFLGGPGTPGILVMNKCLYKNVIPDNSGGGTVKFTTPWKYHEYIDNIEEREDGGTPPFLQGIKAALCFKLKKEMGVENILKREESIVSKVLDRLATIDNLHVLEPQLRHRVGAISFYIDDLHFNLCVKLLNDFFGIQVRGGCACAGTYGHFLLKINQEESTRILDEIKKGDLFIRPGWVRLSIHPTMTDAEVEIILNAIEYVAKNFKSMSEKYVYNSLKNIFEPKDFSNEFELEFVNELFGQKKLATAEAIAN